MHPKQLVASLINEKSQSDCKASFSKIFLTKFSFRQNKK